ncbi:MAG: RIP metalloprotease RseP [Patescibacteria group bacterium]
MSIILFVFILALLILSHEFGHFIIAKKSGVRVDEFGFGFPPRLLKFKKGETIYSINLIPFGGFVKIYGEEGAEKQDPRSFASKPISIRALVIAAGVIFNIFLGWILISSGYMVGLPTSVSSAPAGAEISERSIIILEVRNGTPAEIADLKAGDKILGFNSIEEFQSFVAENKGREVKLNYQRGEENFSAKITPRADPPQGQGSLGISLDEIGIVKIPWYRAVWEGAKVTYNLLITIAVSIYMFVANAIKGLAGFEQVLGPVGIVTVTGTVAKMGFAYILNFVALLSINLAIINILPFPSLDGGRLLFLAIEKIKGSPVNPKISGIIHSIGLALLLILMLAITYHDIMRLI